MDESEHVCSNCGRTFTGNYCPVCSQSARHGRITWLAIWQGIGQLWGIESRPANASAWSLSSQNTMPLLPPPNMANTHLSASFFRDTKQPSNTARLLNYARTTLAVGNARYIPTNLLFPRSVMLVGQGFFFGIDDKTYPGFMPQKTYRHLH